MVGGVLLAPPTLAGGATTFLQMRRLPLLRPLVLLNKIMLREWDLNQPYKGGVGAYLLFVMVNQQQDQGGLAFR